jgi:molybdenum cofactor biosynthesis protein B
MEEPREFLPLSIAILTVSDTRTLADDKSGQTLQERIAAAGHSVADWQITRDDIVKIHHINGRHGPYGPGCDHRGDAPAVRKGN